MQQKEKLREELKGLVESAEQPFVYTGDIGENPFWYCLRSPDKNVSSDDVETFKILLSAKNLPSCISYCNPFLDCYF